MAGIQGKNGKKDPPFICINTPMPKEIERQHNIHNMEDDDPCVLEADQRPLLEQPNTSNSSSGRYSADEDVLGRRRCIKNAMLHSLAVMLAFTSFTSLQDLPKPLNQREGIGPETLGCVYVGLIVSCMISPFILKYTGYKWAIVGCLGVHCVFAAVNFYPNVYVLAPFGLLLGLSTGPFWTAQGQFLTAIAIRYAEYIEATPEVIISRFTGMFYMFLQSAYVWSNVISTTILKPVPWNATYNVSETCGAPFCHYPNGSSPAAHAPSQHETYVILGTYLGCCIMGVIVHSLFVDNVKPISEKEGSEEDEANVKTMVKSMVTIHLNGCMLLLLPLMIYNGMEQMLIFMDFSQAFVGCEMGPDYIGYAIMTYGATSSVFSFAVGQLEKCSGRIVLFLVAGVINIAMLMTMLEWTPGVGSKGNWLLYFIPGWWGIADAVWQSTMLSLVATEFKHLRTAAFATYRMWQGVGLGAAFLYSYFLCMKVKVLLVLGWLLVSLMLYLVMEVVMRRRVNRPYRDLYAPIIE